MEELARRLTAWIKEQVVASKQHGVVFGLSGGIDSSVVGVLCKQAFPHHCIAAIMPCQSIRSDIKHALMVAEKFLIPVRVISLDSTYKSLLKAMPRDGFQPETQRIAEANLKPRLRMASLYYLANRLGYLVVGTSNRSEIAVGYFTKYGDGGVDISPLGNLLKSEVRQLARHLGVPEEIVEKPPSGGLWEGQTDEGEMGITYEELDGYINTGNANEQVRQRIAVMMANTAHKREMPPIPHS